mmetsp:Transcript_8462/g.17635  ORF Transcript_8462/g.17635 Transcript_8462/m.17635 type:complete len:225 (+) Transcript_8462:156-830(+)
MHRIISIAFTLLFLAGSGVNVSAARPSNDRCIDSITLIPFEKVTGDNTEANFDYNNQGVCGARSDRRAVWYEINGVGKEVTINVCSNNYQITDFGIFRACNTQNCLGAPTQQMMIAACDAEEQNEYSFLAEDGASYYVHVRSDVFFEGIGSNHTIWYTQPTDEPTTAPMTKDIAEDTGEDASNSIDSSAPTSGSVSLYGGAMGMSIVLISFAVSGLVSGFVSLL